MRKHIVKRAMLLSMVSVVAASSFAACGSKDKGANASARKVVKYDIKDYVTLGQYTGLSVEEDITQVTDQDIQEKIDSLIDEKTTYNNITDRGVEKGDKIKINYTSYVDGQQTDNQTSYELKVGEEQISEEFDDKMIDLTVGANLEFTIGVDTPDEDGNVKKEDTTYNVTVLSIEEPVVPEFNDAFVAANSDYATVDEYKAGTRTELENQNAESAKSQTQSKLLTMITDSSKITGCPTFVYNINYNQILSNYAMYAKYFGGNLDSYMQSSGITYDSVKMDAVKMTRQTLVIEAICKDAKIDITDKQYKENLKKYVTDYGYKSTDDVEKQFSREELLFDMRRDAAIEYIYNNNTVTQVTVSENDDTDTVEDTSKEDKDEEVTEENKDESEEKKSDDEESDKDDDKSEDDDESED